MRNDILVSVRVIRRVVVVQVTTELSAAINRQNLNIPSVPAVVHRLSRPKKTAWYVGFLKVIGEAILVFLLSRFALPGGIHPAGVGYCLVDRHLRIRARVLIWLGFLLGNLTVREFRQALGLTLMVALITILHSLPARNREKLTRISVFVVWALLRIALALLFNPGLNGVFEAAVELIVSFLLAGIFQIGAARAHSPLRPSKMAAVTLATILVLTVGGTTGMMMASVSITDICVSLVLLIGAYLGGGGIGAAMGVSLAIAIGLTTGSLITLIALYSTSGFMGGLLKNLGKWGTIIGAGLGYCLILQQLHMETDLTKEIIPWTFGFGAFILMPKRYLTQISNYFPTESKPVEAMGEKSSLKELILNRLNDLSSIFTELAKSFNEEIEQQPVVPKMDLYSLLDHVCTKNCQQCNGYKNCWGENFYSTYRELFDLLALAELYGEVNTKHLKGRLAKNCFQQFKLLTTINHLFERCQADYYWRRKLDESKSFLANQLQGMAQIIGKLAVQLTEDPEFRSEVENQLISCLGRVGINIKEVFVIGIGDQGVEIRIRQHSCNRKRECQYLTAPLISQLLGEDYAVWERNCQVGNGDCYYCLTPECQYETRTVVCKIPKNGNEASGDNHALHELKDGHFVAILSDGMGNGSKAAVQSKATVSILEKLLETGVDRDFAVKMLNSVLLLRTPEESFATVDLGIIDLYTGRSEFIKIGAATSYIKRGRDVWSIKSTSLPAGILNSVDVERTVVQLQPGDLIIMATDGVIDSKINPAGKEDWVVRALRQVEVVGPEALGEYLLNLAKINQDGAPKDDMTVIVLQLTEKRAF